MSDKQINDGGPAFPVMGGQLDPNGGGIFGVHPEEKGLTIRDYFAAKAMQALIAHHGDDRWHPDGEVKSMRGAADTAYEYADALLQARTK